MLFLFNTIQIYCYMSILMNSMYKFIFIKNSNCFTLGSYNLVYYDEKYFNN